jgi:replicative DNA helicase
MNNINQIPPSDVTAERCLLSSIMLFQDVSAQAKLIKRVRPDSFFLEDHRIIFSEIAQMSRAGRDIDFVSVLAELRNADRLENIGGEDHLKKILFASPSYLHGETHAAIVLDLAARRGGWRIAEKMQAKLSEAMDGEAAKVLIQSAITELWEVSNADRRTVAFSLEEILHQFLEEKQQKKAPALLTGISSLDDYAGIFSFGKYTIVAGRPSMGKSTFVRWLLMEWARHGTPVGLVAVEEDRKKIAGNYLSAESGIENHVVAYRDWNGAQWDSASKAVGNLSSRKWFGVDTAFTLDEVSTAIEMLATEKGCKVVAVDHIHLVTPDHRSENEQREIKEVSKRMKELAKRYNVVLVAAAQLSRPFEKTRVPSPPALTDLRGSGGIEEHADAVLLLHREDYYRKGEAKTHECQVGIEKNRNGEIGRCTLIEDMSHQRFFEAQPTMGFSGDLI